jgi:hypothetical protein
MIADFYNKIAQKQTSLHARVMTALPSIVLQNSAAFFSWAGFEHWSACGVLR